MRISIAGGKLHNTKPVAIGLQAKGFCIDRNRAAKIETGREVVQVNGYGHSAAVHAPFDWKSRLREHKGAARATFRFRFTGPRAATSTTGYRAGAIKL
jgi:hypothetical protein